MCRVHKRRQTRVMAEADEPRVYFLVQWEDRLMSVIQAKDVVLPQKAQYQEGDLIEATYQKHTYHAVISEIHHDWKFLMKQAKLPPKHAYEAAKDKKAREQSTDIYDNDELTSQEQVLRDDFEADAKSESEEDKLNKAVKRKQNDEEIAAMDQDAKKSKSNSAVPLDKSPPATPSGKPTSSGMPSEMATPGRSSPEGTSAHVHTSSKKSLEQRVELLEREVKELRRKVKSIKRSEQQSDSDSSTYQRTLKEKDLDEILETVKHLYPKSDKEINDCIQRICFSVFTKEELVSSSRTGKKTVRSPREDVRPPLDKAKMDLLERAVLTKCPDMSTDTFKKKIDNIIKMSRRKEKK